MNPYLPVDLLYLKVYQEVIPRLKARKKPLTEEAVKAQLLLLPTPHRPYSFSDLFLTLALDPEPVQFVQAQINERYQARQPQSVALTQSGVAGPPAMSFAQFSNLARTTHSQGPVSFQYFANGGIGHVESFEDNRASTRSQPQFDRMEQNLDRIRQNTQEIMSTQTRDNAPPTTVRAARQTVHDNPTRLFEETPTPQHDSPRRTCLDEGASSPDISEDAEEVFPLSQDTPTLLSRMIVPVPNGGNGITILETKLQSFLDDYQEKQNAKMWNTMNQRGRPRSETITEGENEIEFYLGTELGKPITHGRIMQSHESSSIPDLSLTLHGKLNILYARRLGPLRLLCDNGVLQQYLEQAKADTKLSPEVLQLTEASYKFAIQVFGSDKPDQACLFGKDLEQAQIERIRLTWRGLEQEQSETVRKLLSLSEFWKSIDTEPGFVRNTLRGATQHLNDTKQLQNTSRQELKDLLSGGKKPGIIFLNQEATVAIVPDDLDPDLDSLILERLCGLKNKCTIEYEIDEDEDDLGIVTVLWKDHASLSGAEAVAAIVATVREGVVDFSTGGNADLAAPLCLTSLQVGAMKSSGKMNFHDVLFTPEQQTALVQGTTNLMLQGCSLEGDGQALCDALLGARNGVQEFTLDIKNPVQTKQLVKGTDSALSAFQVVFKAGALDDLLESFGPAFKFLQDEVVTYSFITNEAALVNLKLDFSESSAESKQVFVRGIADGVLRRLESVKYSQGWVRKVQNFLENRPAEPFPFGVEKLGRRFLYDFLAFALRPSLVPGPGKTASGSCAKATTREDDIRPVENSKRQVNPYPGALTLEQGDPNQPGNAESRKSEVDHPHTEAVAQAEFPNQPAIVERHPPTRVPNQQPAPVESDQPDIPEQASSTKARRTRGPAVPVEGGATRRSSRIRDRNARHG
jgi:hypothetical protein